MFEDGKEQRIEFFSATVVLFDRLNTRFEDQVPARDQIIKFLANLRSNARVALYVLESNEVRVLHDFTHDAASPIATIKRFRAGVSIEQAVADTPVPQLAPSGVESIDREMQQWLQQTTDSIAAEYTRRRIQITLSAIEGIAEHVGGIPGRKNLVWISSGFPLVTVDALTGPQTVSREVTRAVQAVNRSHLSIYPIDMRGLVAPYSGPAATATYQTIGRGPGFSMTRTIARRSGDSTLHVVVRDAASGVAGSVRITR